MRHGMTAICPVEDDVKIDNGLSLDHYLVTLAPTSDELYDAKYRDEKWREEFPALSKSPRPIVRRSKWKTLA